MAAIAVLPPQSAGEERLSLGIVDRTGIIHECREDLVRELRGAVSRHVGPTIVHNEPSYRTHVYA